MKTAILRACASCEWIFKMEDNDPQCPKCDFGSYGARYAYGNIAYKYAKTQKPWMDKKIHQYTIKLLMEIDR